MKPADKLKEGQNAYFGNPPDHAKAKQCFVRVTSSAPNWVEGSEAFEKAKNMSEAIEQWEVVAGMEPCYPSYDEPIKEAQRKLLEYGKR